jgi:hypothetical protein
VKVPHGANVCANCRSECVVVPGHDVAGGGQQHVLQAQGHTPHHDHQETTNDIP